MSAEGVLITGGAGFIGSHLAERLLAEGHSVVLLDNFDDFYDPAIKRSNVAAALKHARCRMVEGDIRDARALDEAFGSGKPDRVVHLAARAGVRPSIRQPELYASVNLLGTVSVLEACRRHGTGKLIFGSSSSVYGNNRKVPFAEDDPVDRPISPYGATKKAGEVLCHAHHHLHDLPVACLRFFTVYGPRQRPEMAIHKFARRILAGDEVEQYGDGTSARDYTYVNDIVDGIVRAMDRCSGYHVWNLGGTRTTTLATLLRSIGEQLGVEPKIRRLPAQPGDVERTWADGTRAAAELGWTAKVEIDRGLELFLQWLKGQL
jgi:UDP-glucuronate 4-epimerase